MGLSQLVRGELSRQDYVHLYGHRGPHEFEFSLPRPADDPAWLDQQLAEFERSPVDIEALMMKGRASFEAAWHRLSEHYPWRAKSLRRRIDQVAPRARLREAIRSEFGHVTWIIRRWALRAGELTGLEDDVFFLTVDEILAVLAGNQRAMARIPARRETFARYQALPPYPAVIRGQFDPFQWAADPNRRIDVFDSHAPTPTPQFGKEDEDADLSAISGAAGAAGRVEGIVRRLDSPDEAEWLRPGEILVTAQTNIGWTVLFSRAAAIVTDVGAPLSHTAIIARELGIPAVVGCGDATQRLKTGDRVFVDGGQGVVRLLERS
jgi:pyruvate,water dikinase